jgi:hypothetical protein
MWPAPTLFPVLGLFRLWLLKPGVASHYEAQVLPAISLFVFNTMLLPFYHWHNSFLICFEHFLNSKLTLQGYKFLPLVAAVLPAVGADVNSIPPAAAQVNRVMFKYYSVTVLECCIATVLLW